jgi:hypothetical protein
LLTEFALSEFKRGLAVVEAPDEVERSAVVVARA